MGIVGGGNVEGVLSLDDVRLEGRTIIYRVDANSPLEPATRNLLDDSRLHAIVPTLRELSNSKVAILTHQSRPGRADFTDTSRHCERLSEIMGRSIKYVPDVCGDEAMRAIEGMADGDLIFLENVRMSEEEYGVKFDGNEDTESAGIVARLASVADVYLTDAFATAHRRSPTLTGFTNTLPCVAGSLMEDEIKSLRTALYGPPNPYLAILGGAKCDDSFSVALNLIDRGHIDRIAFVGICGNLMLWADGNDIGERNRQFIQNTMGKNFDKTWDLAEKLTSNHPEILFLPRDLIVEIEGGRHPQSLENLPSKHPIYDIGFQTLMDLRPLIMEAGCVLWNGPASYFELPGFAFGTIEILNMCVETSAITIIGGGHTGALVNRRGVADNITHNSTGGGATMSFLSGDSLPVIGSLKESCKKFSDKLDEMGLAS
ncbi:MAG: phosphoglycerate kinase [Euryarchaeota archaeon]|jgi:phosphoglycerate kinase|nr:phosphoglycerate kinase [Euryarchaeota archaeon]|tara:strand:- start:42 stop:1331 length:1290 start_codon:yes stop_codon:yes gene_type:complete